MLKSVNVLSLFFLLGIIILPSREVIACGKAKVEKSCCNKKDTENCCKAETDNISKSNENKSNDDECGGKCGQKICHCNNLISTFLTPAKNENKNIELTLETNKIRVSGNENLPSSIFLTIWTPPNIS